VDINYSKYDDLTYEDEFRIAVYLVAKHRNTSPAWLSRMMKVQYPQASRWLARMKDVTG
jgi:hypothetical protein